MVSLEKRTEDAQATLISLLKDQKAQGIDLGELVAQVEVAIDFSYSMKDRYRKDARTDGKSEVQIATERALALALSGLDDDGSVPVHFFDDKAYKPIVVDKSNYTTVVDNFAASHEMGATEIGGTIKAILGSEAKKTLFRRSKTDEKDQPPKLVLFITDGAPSDKAKAKQMIIDAAGRPVFWVFIGLGNMVGYLDELDKMPGRVVDNVALVKFNETASMSDTEFFNAVISEFFTQWLPEARRLGITRK